MMNRKIEQAVSWVKEALSQFQVSTYAKRSAITIWVLETAVDYAPLCALSHEIVERHSCLVICLVDSVRHSYSLAFALSMPNLSLF